MIVRAGGPRRWSSAVAFVLVTILIAGGFASAQMLGGRVALPHALVTPPPLPIQVNPLATPSPAPTAQAGTAAARRAAIVARTTALAGRFEWHYAPDAPALKARVPTLAEMRARVSSSHLRRPANAQGGTIILNGQTTVPVINQNYQYGFDATVSYASTEYLQCMNLAAGKTYKYYVFPPKGATAVQVGAAGGYTTNAAGNCTGTGVTTTSGATLGPAVTFSTPYGSGTDTAYPAVWAIGALNTSTGLYDAITFVDVESTTTITTTSDSAGTIATNDFVSGSVVYLNATGLNPSDSYAFGVIFTGTGNGSTTPNKCVYTLPASTMPAGGPCFNNGGAINGVVASSGSLTVGWNTSTGTSASGTGGSGSLTGNYAIQLFDVTRGVVVGTTQVSMTPGTSTWTLTPYNGATAGAANGYNGSDVFAFDGASDQAVKQIDFAVTGITTGHSDVLSISDPTGAVMIAPVTATSAATTDFGKVTLPVKGGTNVGGFGPFYPPMDIFGPTALTNVDHVYTAQVYDKTTGTAVASKTFVLLGYFAGLNWTSPNVSVLQPSTGNTTVTGTATITNTGYGQLGTLNADGLVGIKISGNGTQYSVALPGGVTSTTATDSKGNVWNVTYTAGGGGTVTITPQTAGVTLGQNTSLPVTLVVTIVSGQCTSTTACALNTQILPQHGVGIYSAANAVSDPLAVAAAGAVGAIAGTYGVTVTKNPTQFPTNPQRFNQMMYVAGAAGTNGSSTYSLAISVNNPAGGEDIHSAIVTLPPGVNGSSVTLTNVCQPAAAPASSCASGVGNWIVSAASTSGVSNTTSNQIYLWNTTCFNANSCGVTPGNSVEFVISAPMWTQTSTYADTNFVSNPDGGCPKAAGGLCGSSLGALTFNPNGTTQSSPVAASGSNLDSTELAVFSLDPTTMSVAFSPNSIGAGVTTSTTLNFTNSSASSSSNPDYLDKIYLSVPWGAVPNSITPPAGWVLAASTAGAAPSTPATYTYEVSCLQAGTCASNWQGGKAVTGALAPGATAAFTFNYTGSQANNASPYQITYSAEGANGGEMSSTYTTPLTITSTSAQVAFVGAGGYPTIPNPVPAGTEPTIGSDAQAGVGSMFDYRITNNGANAITSVSIQIPYQNRFGVTPNANLWPNASNEWYVQTSAPNAPTLSGTGSTGCSTPTVTEPTGSGGTPNGSISFTCPAGSFTNGKTVDVTFVMQAPYDIGSEYVFPATLNGSVVGTPQWSTADYLNVVLDAKLALFVPNGPGTSTITRPGVGSPATSTCVACTITQAPNGGSGSTINFGTLSGTFTGTNLVNASVTSDANSGHGWTLYVSVDNNPTNASTSAVLLQAEVNSANSSSVAGYGIPGAATSFATFPLQVINPAPSSTNPVTPASSSTIASYTGAAVPSRTAVDTLMDFRVNAAGDVNTPRTVNVTYTLVPN